MEATKVSERVLEQLPVFLLPGERPPAPDLVAVVGLVATPQLLDIERIHALPVVEFTTDFACEEGWTVPEQRWRGAALHDVLALAGVRPEARYVGVGSGGFLAMLPLEHITSDAPLLAYELNGVPLPPEHGGPLRLVAPWTVCFQSVKWVDRLVLSADTSNETASTIARARNAAR
jgi:DMSO/TMAO reductase YedYZ molybdopterin-dependent catalytic subunit